MPALPATSPDGAPGDSQAEHEASLVKRSQEGNESAFGELMQLHYEKVFRRVVAIVRNEHDARDLCQEIWMQVWQTLSTFRGDARFTTWLFPLATRRAIDHLRKRRRWFDRFLPFSREDEGDERRPDFEPADPSPGPQSTAEHHERQIQFEQAMASLPPALRAVLALREVEGLSYAEIAETLHCPQGTVMSRLHQARRLLLQHLKNLPCD